MTTDLTRRRKELTRVATSERGLVDKLRELQRRARVAKTMLTPSTYLDNPWVRLGLAATVGYLVGRGRSEAQVMGPLGRQILGTVARGLVERAMRPGKATPQGGGGGGGESTE
jgi:hypothetical protein